MGPRKLRKHKSLVLTLVSALVKFIHASIRIPVRMPYIFPLRGKKEQVLGTTLHSAQNALLSHTLKGIQQ